MNGNDTDERLMRAAVEEGLKNPKAAFGAVIADSGTAEIVARGTNASHENPLRHGEIAAIEAGVAEGISDWSNLVLYTTAEPCPMCMAAILWSGIGRVVYGTSVPTLTRLGWSQIQIRAAEVIRRSHRPQTGLTGGVLEADCDRLFQR